MHGNFNQQRKKISLRISPSSEPFSSNFFLIIYPQLKLNFHAQFFSCLHFKDPREINCSTPHFKKTAKSKRDRNLVSGVGRFFWLIISIMHCSFPNDGILESEWNEKRYINAWEEVSLSLKWAGICKCGCILLGSVKPSLDCARQLSSNFPRLEQLFAVLVTSSNFSHSEQF